MIMSEHPLGPPGPDGDPVGFYEIVKDAQELDELMSLSIGKGSLQLRPSQVIDRLAVLRDRMAHPAGTMAEYVHGFANHLLQVGHLGKDPGRHGNDHVMFYPYRPGMNPQQAAEWCVSVAGDMFTATCFQVTTEMMQVAREISYQTAHGSEYIDEPMLPSPQGFVWFDSPLVFRGGRGNVVSTRAASWGVLPIRFVPHDVKTDRPIHSRVIDGMGVRILLWTLAGDPSHYECPEDLLLSIGDLQFDHIMVIPFGERFPAAGRRLPEGHMLPDEDKGIDFTAVDSEGVEIQSSLHYMNVIWQLMNSEIAASVRHAPDRLTAKRVLRSIKHGEVNVITLRRTRQVKDDLDFDTGDVDWTCRWLVQGHWRHVGSYSCVHHAATPDRSVPGEIVYCYKCKGRLAWVKAYIKGPDGKPLKMTKHLYRLSR